MSYFRRILAARCWTRPLPELPQGGVPVRVQAGWPTRPVNKLVDASGAKSD